MSTDQKADWSPPFNRLFGKRASRRTDFGHRSWELDGPWYNETLAVMREIMATSGDYVTLTAPLTETPPQEGTR